jgi:translation initiation factor 2B subunit (eIF-2B alpha/beta/delta family)
MSSPIDQLLNTRARGSDASSAWKYLENLFVRYRVNTTNELIGQVRAGKDTLVLAAKLTALADLEDMIEREIRLGESAQAELTKGRNTI